MEEEKQEVASGWPIKTEGQIPYTITEHEDGRLTVNFEQSLENNLVVLMVASYLAENIVEELRQQKGPDVKTRTHVKNMVTKGAAAKFGLNMISEYMQSIYRNHQRSLRAKVSKMIQDAEAKAKA